MMQDQFARVREGLARHFTFIDWNHRNPSPPSQGIDELGIVHRIGLALSDGDDLTRWRSWEGSR